MLTQSSRLRACSAAPEVGLLNRFWYFGDAATLAWFSELVLLGIEFRKHWPLFQDPEILPAKSIHQPFAILKNCTNHFRAKKFLDQPQSVHHPKVGIWSSRKFRSHSGLGKVLRTSDFVQKLAHLERKYLARTTTVQKPSSGASEQRSKNIAT